MGKNIVGEGCPLGGEYNKHANKSCDVRNVDTGRSLDTGEHEP